MLVYLPGLPLSGCRQVVLSLRTRFERSSQSLKPTGILALLPLGGPAGLSRSEGEAS
ncbi:hypothetical protein OG884_22265 [Streptosporangium sp. NBC_01755]|uniref:hypothetical protein n=1 Tax=unclassified Streptosporangium TaxID=2632669 RepID=UPI002DD9C1A5|nr:MULTISPECIES: hypothetical protein [unclassified Streptosporangium]WSA24313.1 hypothetical protein OIE13_25660 [Streptosporangium sp. NBC_01810]WSC97613.1 hypothetical protein OG884_22265 [Streptosporangium sp. NBC_01755]